MPFARDWVSKPRLTPASPSPDYPPFEDEHCSLLELEDEHPSPEVLLHITYEVVYQLDMVEDYRLLLPEGQSLHDFLED
jgi:hypothetical protein